MSTVSGSGLSKWKQCYLCGSWLGAGGPRAASQRGCRDALLTAFAFLLAGSGQGFLGRAYSPGLEHWVQSELLLRMVTLVVGIGFWWGRGGNQEMCLQRLTDSLLCALLEAVSSVKF